MLLICMVLIVSFPLPGNTQDYEPYDPMEFPAWARNLRRGEILFFGSLPITFAVTGLLMPERRVSEPVRITAALSLSAGIALADYIIGRLQDE